MVNYQRNNSVLNKNDNLRNDKKKAQFNDRLSNLAANKSKNLSELSNEVNEMINRRIKVDISKKGNKVSKYVNPDKHWNKILGEKEKFKKRVSKKIVLKPRPQRGDNLKFDSEDKQLTGKSNDKWLSILHSNIKEKFLFIEPNNPNYNKYAEEAKRVYNVMKSRKIWNNKSMFVHLRVNLPKDRINLEKIIELKIKYKEKNGLFELLIGALCDGGADRSYITDKLTDALD